MKNSLVKNTIITALCIALCYILPFITGQIPQINSIFSPMHIPILLCGFICGPWFAFAAGIISPIFRSITLTMPPMFPTAISMAFELSTYGLFSGLIYKILKNKSRIKEITAVYLSQISAMVLGRFIWATATAFIMKIQGDTYTFGSLMTTAFVQGLPGIICHLIVVPLIIYALKKATVIK